MKLRNLLFGTMIALAFTACSDDNDPNVEPTPEPEGTFLSLRGDFKTTKAAADEVITSLTAIVAKADGEIEAVKTAPGTNVSEVELIPLSVGEKQVIMLANIDMTKYPNIKAGGDLDADVFGAVKTFAGEEDGKLSMSSKLYKDIQIVVGRNFMGYTQGEKAAGNYFEVGAPVKMYRNVAKITLSSFTINAKVSENFPENSNPIFKMDSVFVVQAHNQVKLANADEWGEVNISATSGQTFLNGVTNAAFDYTRGLLSGTGIFGYLPETATYAKDATLVELHDATISVVGSGSETYPEGNENIASFYVFENTNITDNYYTLLVVRGSFEYTSKRWSEEEQKDVPEQVYIKDRYFTIAIGVTGYEQATNGYTPSNFTLTTEMARPNKGTGYLGVFRNLHYVVDLSTNSLGYKTYWGDKGDDTYLDVKVQVVPFGVVPQKVTIE